MGAKRLPRTWDLAAVLLVTLLAATLRFYRLPEVPPGLHFDEGFKGTTARALLQGAPPRLFFESDMGEEPIAMYLVAAALGLVGHQPWTIRLPSAIVGTLTVLMAWWLGRELYRCYPPARWRQRKEGQLSPAAGQIAEEKNPTELQGQVLGLATALILAILYWHLSFSRIGMEPILVPFTATLAFAALLRGLNTDQWAWFVLSGLALGGSLYTYKAGYFVPIVALLFVAVAALVERGFLRGHLRRFALTTVVGLLIAAPIVVYFVTHPANFLQRPASVALAGGESVSTGPLSALADNLPRVLGMFFLHGDANPRSNLPGRPALDPFLAILFLVGLGRVLVDTLRGSAMAVLPLVWVAVMVLPTLVTEHAPHFGRAIGVTPALALLCALGGWTLWQGGSRLGRRWLEVSVGLLLVAGLVLAGASTVRAYFSRWGQSPDLFYAYDVGLVRVAEHVNSIPTSQDVYLTPTAHDHFTLQFLVQRPFASFDGRHGLVLPPPGREATIVVLLREDEGTLPVLQGSRPDGEVTWTMADWDGRPYAAAYHLPALDEGEVPDPWPEYLASALFGDAARLLGYSLNAETIAPGDRLDLVLYWQALTPLNKDYTVFTHLLGGMNPATDSPLWAGHDGQPDGGNYPTTSWQPGQVILDAHTLTVPADAPAGEYQLEVGLYLLETLARLPAFDATGQPLPEDAVLLGTIRVGD